jgi:hypothetical protein
MCTIMPIGSDWDGRLTRRLAIIVGCPFASISIDEAQWSACCFAATAIALLARPAWVSPSVNLFGCESPITSQSALPQALRRLR